MKDKGWELTFRILLGAMLLCIAASAVSPRPASARGRKTAGSRESTEKFREETGPAGISAAEGAAEAEEEKRDSARERTAESLPEEPAWEDADITLGFAGDINFDESWSTTQYMDQQENGLLDCIAPELVEKTNSFDIFMINNEFTYSTRGEKEDKSYNFRADPSRVDNLKLLGTDLVLLANNHVFDYGEEALLDTLNTLEDADIPYVGAGRNIEEASKPRIFTVNGRKIAYVAASSAEYYSSRIATREAGDGIPGIFACYDPEAFLQAIRDASIEADFVIASVHWGLEYDNEYSDMQQELAERMVEAGADAIIGTHTHCIQGVDLIDGVPVYYSLGNFWFNDKKLYSCLAELDLHVPGNPMESVELTAAKFIPCTQYDLYTDVPAGEDERTEILSYLKDISHGRIYVDEDDVIRKKD